MTVEWPWKIILEGQVNKSNVRGEYAVNMVKLPEIHSVQWEESNNNSVNI